MKIRGRFVQGLLQVVQRHPNARSILLLGPGMGWIILFGCAPLLIVLTYSFWTKGDVGEIRHILTMENYLRILNSGLYRHILTKSLLIGLETTVISLLLGYPVAYYLARKKGRRIFLVLLILIPFWTSYLVRIFSWILILMENGVINWLLLKVGLIREPLQLLYTHLGVVIGIVYSSLPFVILPIFAVISGIEEDLINAAKDLGANDVYAFWEVTLPLSLPGVVAATVLAFIYGAGSFLAPAILGGSNVVMISNVIATVFLIVFNWPFASALTITFLVTILFLLLITNRLVSVESIYGRSVR